MTPLQMWIKSADFWDVPYEIVDVDTMQQLDLNQYELVAAIDLKVLTSSSQVKLDHYVRGGGKLLASGNLHSSLASYLGSIQVIEVKRGDTHRCMRISDETTLGNWNTGEILFFTNTYQSSGKDYVIDNIAELQAQRCCESCEVTVVDVDLEQWGKWRETTEPSLITKDVGAGKIVYTPLCLGEMEWVVQPRVPTFTEFPYVVRNNGIMLLIRDIFALTTGSDRFECRPLWQDGAKCVVVLSGDVHDYAQIPGRADREYRDMIDNMNILREYGLDGKATWFITGDVARKFPEEVREAADRNYEICPHTHQDTCYSNEGWDYYTQKDDISRCIDSFKTTIPNIHDYAKGFRTHGYNSNYDTRLALENLGYDYIADLQGWELSGTYNRNQPDHVITYVSLPQYATDYRGRKLNLLEIPDTVANDHFVYRIEKMTPDQALAFYKEGFDRMYRLGGMFQTCLHPYISIKEDPERERVYRGLIEHMVSHENVVFLLMKDLCGWWKEREVLNS
ncbi:polysaccharide deacetylase family protein [Paenibacillus solisilvae]|uniref:Polysaccharide deacetylase family protein n=1 Tax=Paenibacillus solisilvae TaxID=2486751 RepID=A0ABW0W4U6_9BACL